MSGNNEGYNTLKNEEFKDESYETSLLPDINAHKQTSLHKDLEQKYRDVMSSESEGEAFS